MDPAGLTFGRYVLVERIAAGGMGEVYVALQTGIGRFTRPLAVKLLLPHLADDARVVSMFLDEARVGAQMSHANIAQVYDVGQDHDRYFIAMELVRGVSLSGLIAALKGRQEHLSANVLAHIGRSLADGLHMAHEQKAPGGGALELIHRDVTPHNILVSVDGAVKLTDFGIAHVADADRHSRPGMVMGKLGYLAPEQILGRRLDRRVDLFAAGATLYHLAALERPFDTPTGSVLDPLRLPSTPLRVCRPELPRQLVDAVERAMENDLTRRFATARELRNALPVPPPDAADELGAVVRRLCAESVEALELKTERATRTLLNKQNPETQPNLPPVAEREHQTASLPPLLPPTQPERSAVHRRRAGVPKVLVGAVVIFVALVAASVAVLMQGDKAEGAAQAAVSPPTTAPTKSPVPEVIVPRVVEPGERLPLQPTAPALSPASPAGPLALLPQSPALQPAEHQPAEHQPAEHQPAEHQPAEHQPAEHQPAEHQPAEHQPAEHQPAERQPAEHPPADRQPAEHRPADRQPAEHQPAERHPLALQPPARGTLAVDAAPWGEVEIDGKKAGETPIAGLWLAAGTHLLVLKNPDTGKTVRRNVTIVAGQTQAVRVDLR